VWKILNYIVLGRGQDNVKELMCHALLEGWVGYDCMATLDIEHLGHDFSPTYLNQPSAPMIHQPQQSQQKDQDIQPPRRKQAQVSAKEYSAAKECLKNIPLSAGIQAVAHSALSKARSASTISACPTPVKVGS
jgi:hypothetical protein